ncbi:MAG: D-glucuronyl C5-epimerase family protein [Gaiellaceae bacterium]
MRLSLGAAVAVLSLAFFTGSAPARTALPDQKAALAGIQWAVAKGWVERTDAARYRRTVNRSAALIWNLPPARRAPLAANLHQVAQVSGKLIRARATAVFGQLAVNNAYFARHAPPARPADISDADGVVYRYMSGLGYEFHPLANFGSLNGKVAAGKPESAQRLARALVARGVNQPGGGLAWEYYFNYSGGRAPWLSGMAQAVAAQALANASLLAEDDSAKLEAGARAAFRAIPGRLVLRRASGPWIRLYGFNRSVVLNAQLQSLLSLRAYAGTLADGDAATLATAMERAAATDIRRFDSGYWTYYSLPRTPATLDYQKYVVRLLGRLDSADPRLATATGRFAAYAKQPPAFKVASGGLGAVRFWLSKPSSVEISSSAGRTKRLTLYGGWHSLGWKLPARAGAYPVRVKARDWAGNSASFASLPIVRVVPAAVWAVVGSSLSRRRLIMDAAEAGIASRAAATTATSLPGQASFNVGARLEGAAQVPLASSTGLGGVRLTVNWHSGDLAPDAATLSEIASVPAAKHLLVELVAESLPADATGRAGLAAFAGALVGQLPNIDELLLGPVPTVASAPAYSAALASLYDAAKARASALVVAGELNGGKTPHATLTALAEAFSDSGRATPLMDELAFRPAPEDARNAWSIGDYGQLVAALEWEFAGSAQKGSTLPILIDGVATATAIPPEKVGAYPAPPGPAAGVSENAQKNTYIQALQRAVCMPNVSGLVFSRLVDKAGAGGQAADQSGLYYADGSAKTSASAVTKSAALAERGVLAVCPGYQARIKAKTLVFPLGFSSSSPPRVGLTCTRDCAYLVTLERGDGKPVRAKRGLLRADKVATVRLSGRSALPAGGKYRLRVRLVAQVNPGLVWQYRSPRISGS